MGQAHELVGVAQPDVVAFDGGEDLEAAVQECPHGVAIRRGGLEGVCGGGNVGLGPLGEDEVGEHLVAILLQDVAGKGIIAQPRGQVRALRLGVEQEPAQRLQLVQVVAVDEGFDVRGLGLLAEALGPLRYVVVALPVAGLPEFVLVHVADVEEEGGQLRIVAHYPGVEEAVTFLRRR